MGSIVIKRREDITPVRARDAVAPERKAVLSDVELASTRRRFFPDGNEELELFEIELEPDTEVQAHAHSSSEIIYVTRGALVLGAQACGPGAAIFIGADTLYGFRAGSEGASFLNFRGDPRPEYLSKEQFMARRAAAPES
jgi:quercetin dioxygenase-like cupin family protein